MKIRMNLKKDLCVFLIYVLVFISAITQMCFTITDSYIWRIMYHGSVHAIIALSLIYFISIKNLKVNSLTVLLSVMVLFELITSYVNSLFVIPMIFVDVLTWPLVLVVFFYYTKENKIPDFIKPLTFIGVTLVCLLSILNIIGYYSNHNGAAVFGSYYSLTFLPLLYMVGTKKINILYSIFVLLLMLFSLKRAGLIVALAGIGVYYCLLDSLSDNKKFILKNKLHKLFKLLLLLLLIGFIGRYIIYIFDLNILDRLLNLAEDRGSGRLGIWNQVIDAFNHSSQFEKWFGHGFHSVFYQIQPFGIKRFAHNSFVETLYDYGYIGLCFLMCFIAQIIHNFIRMFKVNYQFAPVMGYSIVVMLVLSLVSYFFEQAIMILPLSVIWGMILGSFNEYENDKLKMEALK